MLDTQTAAFLDELEKIAVARHRLRIVAQERKGTRPISVSNFLKKEKNGDLYKTTSHLSGSVKEGWAGSSVPFSTGPSDPAEARVPKKKGDVPSEEDFDAPKREDTRESATTVTGIGQSFNNIGATGNSAGGT